MLFLKTKSLKVKKKIKRPVGYLKHTHTHTPRGEANLNDFQEKSTGPTTWNIALF